MPKSGCLALARGCAKFHAGSGPGYVARIHTRAAIACQRTFHDNFVARLQGVAIPAAASHLMRSTHLEAPVHEIALFVLDVQVDPYVRIGPRDPGHIATDGDRLVGVELRCKGVMRYGMSCGSQQSKAADD